MTRFAWIFVAFACFTLPGCGEATLPAPDEAEVKTTTPIEENLKSAGMENMTQEEYLQGGKQQ